MVSQCSSSEPVTSYTLDNETRCWSTYNMIEGLRFVSQLLGNAHEIFQILLFYINKLTFTLFYFRVKNASLFDDITYDNDYEAYKAEFLCNIDFYSKVFSLFAETLVKFQEKALTLSQFFFKYRMLEIFTQIERLPVLTKRLHK